MSIRRGATLEPLRYSSGFERVLEFAAFDCAALGEREIGPDHLLLGLYREDFPLVDEVLGSFRVDSLVVLDRLLRQRRVEGGTPRRSEEVRMGPAGLRVVSCAEREARRFGHGVLGPPHTLLGWLSYHRDDLGRFFIRPSLFESREDEVLEQVRGLVSWLRFESAAERELDFSDPDNLMGLEMLPLGKLRDGRRRLAVRLRLLKRF